MPMNRSLYPDNWEEIARQVKESADWQCEACGKPCRKPGVAWATFVGWILYRFGSESDLYKQTGEETYSEFDGFSGWVEKPQRFTLTVAHLDHNPANCDRTNLKALCAPCHCRYDLSQMARKKYLKRERDGQLNLLEESHGQKSEMERR